MPEDVKSFVARRFSASDKKDALALLASATIHDGSAADARLLRCAAVASGGSLAKLRDEVERLKIDFRDVIVEGEYVPNGPDLIRVRNLNLPVIEDHGS